MTVAAAVLCGCKKEKKTIDVSGEWNLVSAETKAIEYGGQTVDVWLAFEKESGRFTIYQMIGEGRYRIKSGTWTLTEDKLSGTYDSGKAWSTVYEVTRNDDTLTLTGTKEDGSAGETDTYELKPIPEDIKANAVD